MPNFQRLIARATDSFTEVIAYYLTILAASGLLFSYFEDKPLFESFWWAIVTGLTIGYGDLYPVTVGKIVAIALMHLVPLLIVPLIVARLLITVIENRNEFTHEEQEEMKSDVKEIKKALGLK